MLVSLLSISSLDPPRLPLPTDPSSTAVLLLEMDKTTRLLPEIHLVPLWLNHELLLCLLLEHRDETKTMGRILLERWRPHGLWPVREKAKT